MLTPLSLPLHKLPYTKKSLHHLHTHSHKLFLAHTNTHANTHTDKKNTNTHTPHARTHAHTHTPTTTTRELLEQLSPPAVTQRQSGIKLHYPVPMLSDTTGCPEQESNQRSRGGFGPARRTATLVPRLGTKK